MKPTVPPPHAVIPKPSATEGRQCHRGHGQFCSTSCASFTLADRFRRGECAEEDRHAIRDSFPVIVEAGERLRHLAATYRPRRSSSRAQRKGGPAQIAHPPCLRPCLRGYELRFVLYQVRQTFAGIIGCPVLQLNALPNSSKFCTVPFVRHSPELCGSVFARTRAACSVMF